MYLKKTLRIIRGCWGKDKSCAALQNCVTQFFFTFKHEKADNISYKGVKETYSFTKDKCSWKPTVVTRDDRSLIIVWYQPQDCITKKMVNQSTTHFHSNSQLWQTTLLQDELDRRWLEREFSSYKVCWFSPADMTVSMVSLKVFPKY